MLFNFFSKLYKTSADRYFLLYLLPWKYDTITNYHINRVIKHRLLKGSTT